MQGARDLIVVPGVAREGSARATVPARMMAINQLAPHSLIGQASRLPKFTPRVGVR